MKLDRSPSEILMGCWTVAGDRACGSSDEHGTWLCPKCGAEYRALMDGVIRELEKLLSEMPEDES